MNFNIDPSAHPSQRNKANIEINIGMTARKNFLRNVYNASDWIFKLSIRSPNYLRTKGGRFILDLKLSVYFLRSSEVFFKGQRSVLIKDWNGKPDPAFSQGCAKIIL